LIFQVITVEPVIKSLYGVPFEVFNVLFILLRSLYLSDTDVINHYVSAISYVVKFVIFP